MKLLSVLFCFVLFCSACAPKTLDEESYDDWRHSLKTPEESNMVYGGNTTITKEKRIEAGDALITRHLQEDHNFMATISHQLRRVLVSTGARVRQKNSEIYVQIPSHSVFGANQSTISASFEPILDAIAKNLKEYPQTMIRIIGHTDNSMGVIPAKKLTLQQAASVLNYMHRQGINIDRLLAEGKGSDEPIANNATAAGRAQNRYVEMIIYNIE